MLKARYYGELRGKSKGLEKVRRGGSLFQKVEASPLYSLPTAAVTNDTTSVA